MSKNDNMKGVTHSFLARLLHYLYAERRTTMKRKRKQTCEFCGGPISIVISGGSDVERLCMKCLVTAYPSLEVLSKRL